MKKLIALIVAVMVMMGMCATTFAATNPKVAENGAISINGEGAFVLDATKVKLADDEDIANNSQTTVVVVAGQDAAITTTSIQYINQDSATSFTFIPKDDAEYKAGAEAVKLTAYIGGDEITKATAGYIDYELVAPTTYTVVFYAEDGETVLQTGAFEAGAALTAPTAPAKAEDENNTYAFAGWALKSAPTVIVEVPATVSEAAEYVAVYTATAKATVTFNDGTNTTTVKYAIGTNIVTPAAPTKEGFTFVGWKLADADDSTATKDLSSVLVDGDKNFVAVFEEITVTPPTPDQPTTVTITYQTVNVDITTSTVGSTVGTATLNVGDVIYTSVAEPTVSKYAFIGWYTDAELTTKLDKSATATADMTIYAKMAKVYKYGDVDGDARGAVAANDYKVLKDHITKTKVSDTIGKVVPGSKKKLGDVDGDARGAVAANDYKVLKDHITKVSTSNIIGTNVPVEKD